MKHRHFCALMLGAVLTACSGGSLSGHDARITSRDGNAFAGIAALSWTTVGLAQNIGRRTCNGTLPAALNVTREEDHLVFQGRCG